MNTMITAKQDTTIVHANIFLTHAMQMYPRFPVKYLKIFFLLRIYYFSVLYTIPP